MSSGATNIESDQDATYSSYMAPDALDNINEADSIFQQPWWLDVVAKGQWRDAIVRDNNGEIVARMPYVVKKRYGLTVLCMPPHTQTLGPWFRPLAGNNTTKFSRQMELMKKLIDQLPECDAFEYRLSPHFTNWLPFYWAGFKQTTRYTYRIEDLSDINKVWDGLTYNTKRNIKKAQKIVRVTDDLDIEKFFELQKLTFLRQNMKYPYDLDLIRRLDKTCSEHHARRILFAEDRFGKLHAANYIVWDKNSAYYIFGGGDPELRKSGAQSLLLWEAIKFSSTVTKIFDFEGSMIKSIEYFIRGFGGRQTPYFLITRMSPAMAVLSTTKSLYTSILGRG